MWLWSELLSPFQDKKVRHLLTPIDHVATLILWEELNM